ncbi:uncharacterized protein [Lepeophtheirus salmonis]|uniref:uncharacterized protein isoform X1 n=1 Tax=Lepeophtheirus salmonis TaxID=72036 RepID=UPI001AE215EE|nr:uncharacterized protein LOC121118533 isoform X1 [Lepeophtheirus salmonis]
MYKTTLISMLLIVYLTTLVVSLPIEESKHIYLSSNNEPPSLQAVGISPSPFQHFSKYSPYKLQKRMDFFDTKRSGARGFHEGIFDQGFGGFSPLRKRAGRLVIDKRRPEMTSRGIHADAFTTLNDESLKPYGVRGIFLKRNPEMDTNGFYGDTFNSGFGDFYPSKRVYPSKIRMSPGRYLVHKRFQSLKPKRLTSSTNGFYGDTFSDGFGDFSTTRKRNLGSLNTFHGDTFSHGFGDFQTV